MIETEPMTIRDSYQEKIEKDFYGRKILEESPGDKPMVDPAKGTFNLTDPVRMENLFACHGIHLPAVMVGFSLRQKTLSIGACIATQGNLLKSNAISRGWVEISACISRKGKLHK
jgi:hypothetical protein